MVYCPPSEAQNFQRVVAMHSSRSAAYILIASQHTGATTITSRIARLSHNGHISTLCGPIQLVPHKLTELCTKKGNFLTLELLDNPPPLRGPHGA